MIERAAPTYERVPLRGELGPDPEPLGSERFVRLLHATQRPGARQARPPAPVYRLPVPARWQRQEHRPAARTA